jgi:predicted ATP-grasp superfamily ATP-dependent carboligase
MLAPRRLDDEVRGKITVRRKPRVLVTDGEQRAALAACRGLHAAGYEVEAASTRRLSVAHWSRSCERRVWLPDPRGEPHGYFEALAAQVRHRRYDVLLPGSEASLIRISEHRDVLEPHVAFGLPAHEVVLRSLDKVVLLEEAAAAGLTPPPSRACESGDDAIAATRELGYPVIAKPQRTFAQHDGQLVERAVHLARDEFELERAVGSLGTPLVVQRYVARPRIIFCAAVRSGERLLGLTVARFVRTWPPNAGSAAMAVSIDPPAGLETDVLDFVSRIGLRGIFQVQLLELDEGRFGLIDLNPRLFASLSLALRAGANLPGIWADQLLDRTSTATEGARPSVRYRWEDGELRYMIRHALAGNLREAVAVLRPYRHVAHPYFELLDPVPLAVQGLMLARDRTGRGWRGSGPPAR